MLQQARGLGRDLPLVRVRQVPPSFDVVTDLVDDRGRIVLLLNAGQAVTGIENDLGLVQVAVAPAPLPSFGTGVINADRRRVSMIWLAGWPSASNSQCRSGKS